MCAHAQCANQSAEKHLNSHYTLSDVIGQHKKSLRSSRFSRRAGQVGRHDDGKIKSRRKKDFSCVLNVQRIHKQTLLFYALLNSITRQTRPVIAYVYPNKYQLLFPPKAQAAAAAAQSCNNNKKTSTHARTRRLAGRKVASVRTVYAYAFKSSSSLFCRAQASAPRARHHPTPSKYVYINYKNSTDDTQNSISSLPYKILRFSTSLFAAMTEQKNRNLTG